MLSRFLIKYLSVTLSFFVFMVPVLAATCDVNRPIVLGSGNWGSAQLTTAIQKFVLEKGYGCKTETITSTSLLMLKNIDRGDIDILTELWEMNYPEEWQKIKTKGTAFATKGKAATITEQGWYVPRYVIEGDRNRGIQPMAPDLKSVKDLEKYKKIFEDPNNPNKGLFHNCVIGWGCERVNNVKLEAYGLDKTFTNYRVETGEDLDQAFDDAYQNGKAIVGYSWAPTWLLGKLDMVKLVEPKYSEKKWEALNAAKSGKGISPVAYPSSTLGIAVNSKFAKSAPNIIKFLDRYKLDTSIINKTLADIKTDKYANEEQAVESFFQNYQDIWMQWVPSEVAKNILKDLRANSSSKPT